MTKVKICGITTYSDAMMAVDAGADMLGFNCYAPSPRYITPTQCSILVAMLHSELGDDCPLLIGVFVNEADVIGIMDETGLDFAQLHGDEMPEVMESLHGRAFKALRPRDRNEAWEQAELFSLGSPSDERAPTLLVDAYHKALFGGTGKQTSAGIAMAVQEQTDRMMLAGGLGPENVARRIQALRPWGVDVASGVEGDEKGRKDAVRIHAFMTAVKIADSLA